MTGNAVTSSGNKQVSVVLFDTRQTTEVDFSDSAKGLGYLQDKILDMTHRKGSTATSQALKYVREKVLGKVSTTGIPTSIERYVIVFSGK